MRHFQLKRLSSDLEISASEAFEVGSVSDPAVAATTAGENAWKAQVSRRLWMFLIGFGPNDVSWLSFYKGIQTPRNNHEMDINREDPGGS